MRNPVIIAVQLVHVAVRALPYVIVHCAEKFLELLAGIKVHVVGDFIQALHIPLAVGTAPLAIAGVCLPAPSAGGTRDSNGRAYPQNCDYARTLADISRDAAVRIGLGWDRPR